MDPQWLAHSANVLFGAAYLVRGILWLRLLSIVACTIMAFFNYFAPESPLWVAIYWNVFFAGVNVVQVWLLLHERAALSFTDEEEELYSTVFRNMTRLEFMKILRVGQWETLDPGTTFIEKGVEVFEIRLVYHGTVRVEIDEKTTVEVKDGAFLGEIAFISGSTASGTVTTITNTRLLSWPFEELRKLFRRNPEIRSAFQAVINSDLASKLKPVEPT